MKNSLLVKGSLAIALGMCSLMPSAYAQQTAPDVRDLKTCPGTTVALASALQEATPAGYSLQWWTTNNRQSGTQVSNPAAVGGGNYYAFYAANTGTAVTSASEVEVTYYQPGDVVIGHVGGNSFTWKYPTSSLNTITDSMTQPGTSYGFTFDIYSLDNSFNMEINGVELATQEIQFQSDATSGINVEFSDSDQYEINTEGDIWEMQGSAQAPLIRVSINPDGVVSLYGSKVSNGPLFTLQPIAGSFAFNTIPWNKDSSNTIIVTQKVTGVTSMDGTGYGLDTVSTACPVLDLIATDDTFAFNQGDTSVSVLANDSLDGLIPTIETVTTAVNGSVPTGFTLNPDGTVDVSPTVTPGSYTFDYQICVRGANPPECDVATATIVIASPTPVVLGHFEIQKTNQNALLSWTTFSEQNALGFNVERSLDGKTWQTLGFVPSQAKEGNSHLELSYAYTDRSPVNGQNFYRLKQIDINGQYTFSPIRSVAFGDAGTISVYPNPVNDKVIISGLQVVHTVTISNALGQVVLKQSGLKTQSAELNTAHLMPGMYILTIIDEQGNRSNFKIEKR